MVAGGEMEDRRVARTYGRGTGSLAQRPHMAPARCKACVLTRRTPALLSAGIRWALPRRSKTHCVGLRTVTQLPRQQARRPEGSADCEGDGFATVNGEPTYPEPPGLPNAMLQRPESPQRPSRWALRPHNSSRSVEKGASHRVLSGGREESCLAPASLVYPHL
jgi:hypothetical protein